MFFLSNRCVSVEQDAENVGLLESLLEAGFEAPSWESWSLSGCYPKGMRFNACLDLLGSVSDDFNTKC